MRSAPFVLISLVISLLAGCVADSTGVPSADPPGSDGAPEGSPAARRPAEPVEVGANGTATIQVSAGGADRGTSALLELPPGVPVRLSFTLTWDAALPTAQTLRYHIFTGNPLSDGTLLVGGRGTSPLVVEVPQEKLPASTLAEFYVDVYAERTGAAVDQRVAVELTALLMPTGRAEPSS